MGETRSLAEQLEQKRRELEELDESSSPQPSSGMDARLLIDSNRRKAGASNDSTKNPATTVVVPNAKRRRVQNEDTKNTDKVATLIINKHLSQPNTKKSSRPIIRAPTPDDKDVDMEDPNEKADDSFSKNDSVIDLGHNLSLTLDTSLTVVIAAANNGMLAKVTTWDVASAIEKLSKRKGVPRLDLKVEKIDGNSGATTFTAKPETPCANSKIIEVIDGGSFKLPGRSYLIEVNASVGNAKQQQRLDPQPWKPHFKTRFELCKPGERADTIVVSKIPSRWIADSDKAKQIFSKFGKVVKVVAADNSDDSLHTKFYIQYKQQSHFERAMECLASRSLSFQADGKKKSRDAKFRFHFDKDAYLSDAKIRHRKWEEENAALEEERAMKKAKEEEERERKAEIAAREAEIVRQKEEQKQKELEEKRLYEEYMEQKRLKEEKKRLKLEKEEQRDRELAEALELEKQKELEKAEKKEQKRILRLAKAKEEIKEENQNYSINEATKVAAKLVETKIENQDGIEAAISNMANGGRPDFSVMTWDLSANVDSNKDKEKSRWDKDRNRTDASSPNHINYIIKPSNPSSSNEGKPSNPSSSNEGKASEEKEAQMRARLTQKLAEHAQQRLLSNVDNKSDTSHEKAMRDRILERLKAKASQAL